MFYHFSQNNSGGGFFSDKSVGISHHVVIEASSIPEANLKAEYLGLYFDGCDNEIDCPCCGDRWYALGDWDTGASEPTVYDTPVSPDDLMSDEGLNIKWVDGPEGYIHYADGRVEGFWR